MFCAHTHVKHSQFTFFFDSVTELQFYFQFHHHHHRRCSRHSILFLHSWNIYSTRHLHGIEHTIQFICIANFFNFQIRVPSINYCKVNYGGTYILFYLIGSVKCSQIWIDMFSSFVFHFPCGERNLKDKTSFGFY